MFLFIYTCLQAYDEIIRAGHAFEIVFVSNDIDQSEFDSNTKDMTWAKLPYQDPTDANYANSTSQQLGSKFAVKSLPFLVVLDAAGKESIVIQCVTSTEAFSSGQTITANGRPDVVSNTFMNWFAPKDRFTEVHAHELLR